MNSSIAFKDHDEWFQKTRSLFYTVIAHYSLTVYSIGLFGNGVTLFVFTGKLFRTANFIPYKLIAILELCFCINGFTLALLTEIEETPSLFSAYQFAYVNLPVISVVEYGGWYVMLIMTFERYVAVCHATFYREKRCLLTPGRYIVVITVFILFALIVNSWSAFVVFKVVITEFENITTYRPIARNFDKGAITVKDYYNGIVKALLLLAMTYLTVRMVYRLYKHKQTRSQLRSQVIECSGVDQGTNTASKATSTIASVPKVKNGRMVAMLLVIFVLAVIRVFLSETKRVVHLIWPTSWVMKQLSDPEEMMRRKSLFIYAHCTLYLFSAISLVFDRSFKFFLYVMFSSQFRICVVKKLHKLFASPVGHSL